MAKSNVSSVVNHFPTINEGFATTVGGAGITSGGTTVPLTSTSGLTDGSIFVGVVESGLTNEQVFTGTVDTAGTQITGVKWTRGTNVAHAAGVTVTDLMTGTLINMIVKGILTFANQDGTLKDGIVTDAAVATSAVTILNPTGVVLPYAGVSAPDGWLLCYGQAVSRSTYATLFSLISTTYGTGDGTTTFNLPDLRGRVVAGQDDMGGTSANRLTNPESTTGGIDGDVLGGTGGSETHTLTTAQLASHAHVQDGESHGSGTGYTHTAGTGSWNFNSLFQGSTGNTGGGEAHNNVQPTIVLNYIIKY